VAERAPLAPRPKRADAVRNRALVVGAAAAVFAEQGTDTSVEQVAERAGVGRATVYRSFPTKEHLLAGVAVERLRDVHRLVIAALAEVDAAAALRRVLVQVAELQATDRVMLDALRLEGAIRADATVLDVRILMTGIAQAMPDHLLRDPTAWRRYANLVADALEA
jgi:AcrR family transcriptional regulator